MKKGTLITIAAVAMGVVVAGIGTKKPKTPAVTDTRPHLGW